MSYSSIHLKDNSLYSISDLQEWKPPSITRIISKGILNVGNRMIIFGDEGSWKSILTNHTAHCLATGTSWLGWHTTRCNVFRLQVELPMYSDRERTLKYCEGAKQIYISKHRSEYTDESSNQNSSLLYTRAMQFAYPPNIISRTEHYVHFDESFGIESLKKNIEHCITNLERLPLVLILDPLYLLVGGNTNDTTEMRRFLDNINTIIADYERKGFSLAVILIHHSRKSHTDETGAAQNMGSQDATGTRAFSYWADTIIRLDLSNKNSCRVHFAFTKHRNAEEELPALDIRWHRDTLHPQVTNRILAHDELDEEERDIRSESDYTLLDG
jgi:RecA-family ATPase